MPRPWRPGPHLHRSASHGGRWSWRSTWGELAFALLVIAALSGFALVVPFDIRRAYDSLAWMLLTNHAGAFFRNVHYWAGQLFLLLTIAHTWDHLRRSTELRLRPGVWIRVAFSLPLTGFLMLSGFLLKGDAESQQAARILSASLERIPVFGQSLSMVLLGFEGNRQLIYVHHVATASLLAWLFVAEHARTIWPRRVALIESFVACACLGLFLTPSLHDGLGPLIKGPWYFLGLQEILHWSSHPALVVLGGAILLAWWVLLPRFTDRWLRLSKVLLALVLAGYIGLTAVGILFRGESWAWGFDWSRASYGLTAHGLGAWWGAPVDALQAHPVPVVLGRREGCLFCHRGVKGLSASHAAEAVGCASCHAGNPFSLDKSVAHARMILVPGNLQTAQRSCGTASCHPDIVPRVRGSLMNTMAGIIAVDRSVWPGRRQGAKGAAPANVDTLGHAGADSHLRQLCASCHLGSAKTSWGPLNERSRGGGCNACHLTYSADAQRDLERYRRTAGGSRTAPSAHPSLSLAIGRAHCFGCHSRSGRISTSYEGWMETGLERAPAEGHYRTLSDGRVFAFAGADIHAEKGMDCVDCHTAREVMGDGVAHGRKTEALRVKCEDCHFRGTGRLVPVSRLDSESRKIAALRGRSSPSDAFLAVAGGEPLLNTSIDGSGRPWLTTKSGAQRLELRPPAAVCTEGEGHTRLSCATCHTAWAPRCTRCHTRFDPSADGIDLLDESLTRGAGTESGAGFTAAPPSLGVRLVLHKSVVETFVPGMIITLDRNEDPRARPDNVFRRLYARAFSHTISKGSRSCRSCHNDPVALGYGEGKLLFEQEGTGVKADARGGSEGTPYAVVPRGSWRFASAQPPGPDGLPADAWIGFLQERSTGASTRTDVRPFTVEEQKRILTVGACLTCHESASPVMRGAVTDWKGTLSRVSPRCVLPRW